MPRLYMQWQGLFDLNSSQIAVPPNQQPLQDVPLLDARDAKTARDKCVVREMLGRWVSELEPALATNQRGDIIGLTMADAPVGSKPFVLRI
jgi:hypothetical protein